MPERLVITPCTLREARVFVQRHHRHHAAPQGGLFAIQCSTIDELYSSIVGCAIVGRPVARLFNDSWTAEVTRLCVLEGFKNSCSMLYASCWRAARAMGYRRLITYTLKSENGASVRGAGWKEVGTTAGGSWSRRGRPRVDTHPLEQKVLWEVRA